MQGSVPLGGLPMGDAWKAVERRHAKDHNAIELGETKTGGKILRLGPTGRDLPDSVSTVLAIESKLRDTLPAWLKEAVEQAEENEVRYRPIQDRKRLARGAPITAWGLLPVVILHENKSKYDEDLVVMSDRMFRRLVMPLLENYIGWHDPMKEP